MKQKIVTVFIPFKNKGAENIDSHLSTLSSSGYIVKQIVSCSLDSSIAQSMNLPTLAITLLLEKTS